MFQISVSQLNDNVHTIVTFNSIICVIQDQSMEMIGMGIRRDGLFYFSKPSSISTIEAPSTLELWHRRLGHC